ncbi:MAG: hypothetical protein ABIH25_02510 [Candidatus Woesearchaeota archaeon]
MKFLRRTSGLVKLALAGTMALSGCAEDSIKLEDIPPIKQVENRELKVSIAIMSGYHALFTDETELMFRRYENLREQGYNSLPSAIMASAGRTGLSGLKPIIRNYELLMQMGFDEISAAHMAASEQISFAGLDVTIENYNILVDKFQNK